MKNPTNRDLHVLLARIEERQINIAHDVTDSKTWQIAHQITDNNQFKELEEKMSSMTKYAISIAGVSAFLGGCVGYFVAWFRKS